MIAFNEAGEAKELIMLKNFIQK